MILSINELERTMRANGATCTTGQDFANFKVDKISENLYEMVEQVKLRIVR